MKSGFNPDQPVVRARDFYNQQSLTYFINQNLRDEKSVLVLGHSKSGKSSLINVLPELLQETYIPVPLRLDLVGRNPSLLIAELFFTSAFKSLLEKGLMETSHTFYTSWARQVNRGDLSVPIADELLATGSRIAFSLNHPQTAVSLDADFIEEDWRRLQEFVRSLSPGFRNFVFLLDTPLTLMNVDDQARGMLRRILGTRFSPLMVVSSNLPDEKNDSDLFNFLLKLFPQEPGVLALPTLTWSDISTLIEEVHPELDRDSVIRAAISVERITTDPYLVKALLEIAESRLRRSGEFTISSKDCLQLARKSELAKIDLEKLKTLDTLREENEAQFLVAANTLLAVSTRQTSLKNLRKVGQPAKTVNQIVLSLLAPDFVEATEIALRQEGFLAALKKLWVEDLFYVIDSDGRHKTVKNMQADELLPNSEISADTNPLILSYLRMAAREIDENFRNPGAQGYFRYVCLRFARKVVSEVSKRDYRDHSHIQAFDFIGNNRGPRNLMSLEQAIADEDLSVFVSYFRDALRNSTVRRDFLPTSEAQNSYVALTLTFSNMNLPETYSFSFLLKSELANVDKTLERSLLEWSQKNKDPLRSTYGVSLDSYVLSHISEELVKALITVSNSDANLPGYLDLFYDGKFDELAPRVSETLKNELSLLEALPFESELALRFKRDVALPLSFMAASCGYFDLGIKGLSSVMKNTLDRTVLVDDDTLVAYAAIGELDKALVISRDLLRLIRVRMPNLGRYSKVVHVPWDHNTEILGSSVIELDEPSLFLYELQHASLLLLKQESSELSQEDQQFLHKFTDALTQDIVIKLEASNFPAHRLLAYFLWQVGRSQEASRVLSFAPLGDSAIEKLQHELARQDLKMIYQEDKKHD